MKADVRALGRLCAQAGLRWRWLSRAKADLKCRHRVHPCGASSGDDSFNARIHRITASSPSCILAQLFPFVPFSFVVFFFRVFYSLSFFHSTRFCD